MRIILLTQDEPFYLASNIDYLISNLPKGNEVVATVLFEASPFGKKKSFFQKMIDTYLIFGLRFFVHYGFQFLWSRLNKRNDVSYVLEEHNVQIIRLKKNINNQDSLSTIRSYNPDLLISIAGNQIFKKELIDLAPNGCLNLHTALLPKYRGIMPSFWVLRNNEKETGVSVFFVDEGIDSGEIIVQKHLPIDDKMTQQKLIKVSKQIGMDAIIEAITKIQTGGYSLIHNDDENKTYYSFPTKEDVKEFYRIGKRFF